ncbi:MAG: caspase family protein [Deltaproteobacteria bacterium]|nr:caspase family protein [Deltaproteobacteria bacterium]
MDEKTRKIILCFLLIALFISTNAFCAPKSKRGVKIAPKAPPSFSELYDNSYAVIIGVNRYDKWPSLEYAVNDAKAIEKRLKDLGFETKTLIDHNATKANILKLLGDELPRKAEKNDRVVIFFAGHGQTEEMPDGTQMGYIIPVDADLRDIFSTAISMDQVRIFSKRLKAKHVLYLIDSCYSGLGLSRSGAIPPGERDYLRKITTRKAHQMLTAGSKGEQTKEEGAHGLFTKYVLEALDGQADRDEKGYITFSDLASYVKPKVSREAGNSQTPQYGNIDGEGEFVFVTGNSNSTDVADSRAYDAIAVEGKKIDSEKQRLAVERKKLDAEKARLDALKEQQEEKARIAEEARRLEEEKERLRQDKERSHTQSATVDSTPARITVKVGRFIAYDNETVLDTQTNLMWASKDNGSDINWANAKLYCENYRGGGFTDWRMPTQDELEGLYESGAHKDKIKITRWIWASETRGSKAAYFYFGFGVRHWYYHSLGDDAYRALPVRSGK